MNPKLKLTINLALIFCLFFVLTGCSSSNSTSSEDTESKVTRTIDYSKESIDRSIDNLKADFDQLRVKIANATNEDAQSLKEDLNQLKINVEGFDRELTNAVTNGKLADDLKKSYDGFIETVKTDLNNLNTELESK